MLRFETKSVTFFIDPAVFSFDAVEEISRIKLDARLGRQNLEHASAGRFVSGRGQSQLARIFSQNPVLVVTAAEFYLLVISFDPRTDDGRRVKIERSVFDRAKLARRN